MNWIENSQVLNKELWLAYNSTVKKQFFFENTIIQKIHMLNTEYYETLSLVINHKTYEMQQRLMNKNLPDSIVHFQNIFVESFSTAISSVDAMVRASGKRAPCVGSKYVSTLESHKQDYLNERIKSTCFRRFVKIWEIQKDLIQNAEIPWSGSQMLKEKLEKQLFCLRILFLKKSNLKLLSKNYNANTAR